MQTTAHNLEKLQESRWDDRIPEPMESLTDDTELLVEGYGSMKARQSMNELVDIVCEQEAKEFIQMDINQLEIAGAHIKALVGALKKHERTRN